MTKLTGSVMVAGPGQPIQPPNEHGHWEGYIEVHRDYRKPMKTDTKSVRTQLYSVNVLVHGHPIQILIFHGFSIQVLNS